MCSGRSSCGPAAVLKVHAYASDCRRIPPAPLRLGRRGTPLNRFYSGLSTRAGELQLGVAPTLTLMSVAPGLKAPTALRTVGPMGRAGGKARPAGQGV